MIWNQFAFIVSDSYVVTRYSRRQLSIQENTNVWYKWPQRQDGQNNYGISFCTELIDTICHIQKSIEFLQYYVLFINTPMYTSNSFAFRGQLYKRGVTSDIIELNTVEINIFLGYIDFGN